MHAKFSRLVFDLEKNVQRSFEQNITRSCGWSIRNLPAFIRLVH